jgi:SAM-dependent methyltransferase
MNFRTEGSGSAADLSGRLQRWRDDLTAWAIPEHITAAVSESPWVIPQQVFARRADRAGAAPSGPSYQRAWAALDPPGSVLDVGSGAGAASLPLLPRTTSLTAVDADAGMLTRLAERAAAGGGVAARVIAGRWPDVASLAGPADVVTCHHVLYNVPELQPFVTALTGGARRLVVVEVTARHPLTPLNPLWLRFHGLRRPDSPTAADLIGVLQSMGLRPGYQEWRGPHGRDYASLAELADVTRRRLCLPPERAAEVADALVQAGADPQDPASSPSISGLPSPGRDLVTIWWDGGAG